MLINEELSADYQNQLVEFQVFFVVDEVDPQVVYFTTQEGTDTVDEDDEDDIGTTDVRMET